MCQSGYVIVVVLSAASSLSLCSCDSLLTFSNAVTCVEITESWQAMQWRETPDGPRANVPLAYLCLCAGNSIKSLNLSLFLEGRLEDKWPDRAYVRTEPLSLACEIVFDWKLLVRYHVFIVQVYCESDMTFWSTVMCLTESGLSSLLVF